MIITLLTNSITLNYPILFRDIAKFSRILYKNKKHLDRLLLPVHVVLLSCFHFSMSQNRIQKVTVKKTESLNYPNSIWEILAMSQIFSMFFKNLCFFLNENSRCLDFFTDTVWILENLHKFQLIIWNIAKISWIVF